MHDGAILTDVAGVKEPIVQAARSRVRAKISFVATHPMFGGERGGYAGSRPDLWKNGVVAVCRDRTAPPALAAVARLHRALGARVVTCTAAQHDLAAAAVSHMPYLVASALALTPKETGALARRLAGRGLADTTRLAAFDYEIQGAVARRNAHLARTVHAFRANLRTLLKALASSEGVARRALRRSRLARESLFPSRSAARKHHRKERRSLPH
jgi:prephenate dehydrogenase